MGSIELIPLADESAGGKNSIFLLVTQTPHTEAILKQGLSLAFQSSLREGPELQLWEDLGCRGGSLALPSESGQTSPTISMTGACVSEPEPVGGTNPGVIYCSLL